MWPPQVPRSGYIPVKAVNMLKAFRNHHGLQLPWHQCEPLLLLLDRAFRHKYARWGAGQAASQHMHDQVATVQVPSSDAVHYVADRACRPCQLCPTCNQAPI